MKKTAKFTVISTGGGPADCFLPRPALVAKGAGRVYRIYRLAGTDYQFNDIDGELLVESRTFDTLDAARAWAQQDIGLRTRVVVQ